MDTIQDILQLRKKVRQLENETSNIAVFAPSANESDAYDRLAMELHDLDTALFNAVFIKNDSKIPILIEGIQKAAGEAAQVRSQLSELTNAFKKARDIVQNANNFAGKAKETLDGVKGLLETMKEPV